MTPPTGGGEKAMGEKEIARLREGLTFDQGIMDWGHWALTFEQAKRLLATLDASRAEALSLREERDEARALLGECAHVVGVTAFCLDAGDYPKDRRPKMERAAETLRSLRDRIDRFLGAAEGKKGGA